MTLPELIEIVPPRPPLWADLSIPGSKSITNRALILAVLGTGDTVLHGALWSEDTQVMVDCLHRLGFQVAVSPAAEEPSNRTIRVTGRGGAIGAGGTEERPLELFVGNAGTAARFLTALVCLGRGTYRLSGVPRMHERPQAALLAALRQLGYRVTAEHDRLPAIIQGGGRRSARCQVSIAKSSQFASALLLCAQPGDWQVEVEGQNAEESPYIEMTRKLIQAFPQAGGTFQIEPDASSGSYFVAADFLLRDRSEAARVFPGASPVTAPAATPSQGVRIRSWPASDWQVDARFPRYLPLPIQVSRDQDLGDSIMTAIVLAPWADHPVRFTDLARLRVQECERVSALRTELLKCGGKVLEEAETLTVYPSLLHGSEVDTYQDHRMAMCFATLGLKVPGIKIKNPACVKKTFPNFYQKLAAPSPRGLGVTILDPVARRVLSWEELGAD